MRHHFLDDAGAEPCLDFAPPPRRLAENHQIVGTELILIENAIGSVGRRLELEHDAPALGTLVFHLGVAGGIAPGILVAGFLGPAFDIDAFLLEDGERALQVAHARQLEARIHHVLARYAQLQAARPQRLVDGAHIKHDDVAFVIDRKPRGELDGYEGFLGTVDAGENTETVASLLAQILQSLLHRPFLPVAELGALEQVLQHARMAPSCDSESSSRYRANKGWRGLRG